MTFLIPVLLVSTVAFASGADTSRVPRAKIAAAERYINGEIASMVPEEPYFLIGFARGAYLDGVGAVFSVEINLATGPAPSPFRPAITKEETQKLRERKESRLPQLKQRMANILTAIAGQLDTLPAGEELVFAVTLLRYPYEDPASMPSQVLMRVNRGKLLEAQRLASKPALAIRTQEF